MSTGAAPQARRLLLLHLLLLLLLEPCSHAQLLLSTHLSGREAGRNTDQHAEFSPLQHQRRVQQAPGEQQAKAAHPLPPHLEHHRPQHNRAPMTPVVTINEQLQQAHALGQGPGLTQEQLERGNPLLDQWGRIPPRVRSGPADWPEGYVAICAVVKNQPRDLREWVEYHRHIGISKIYVYDNNSAEPMAGEISDFLHSGVVEYSYFVGRRRWQDLFRTTSQWWAYNDCITRFAHRHRWLAFIDVDEFIVLHPGAAPATDINTFMAGYERYGGLALNWVIFGSSGHKERPRGGVLLNYVRCLPWDQVENNHVKVVANTAHVLTVGDDPHSVFYRTPGAATVNELGVPVPNAKSTTPSHTRVALYHYLTKSEEEYAQKMARGSAAGNYKNMAFFRAIDALATAECTRGVELGRTCCPSVQAELAGVGGPAPAPAPGARLGGGASVVTPNGVPHPASLVVEQEQPPFVPEPLRNRQP